LIGTAFISPENSTFWIISDGFLVTMCRVAITPKPVINKMAATANLIGAYAEASANTIPKKKRIIMMIVPSKSLESIKEKPVVLIIQLFGMYVARNGPERGKKNVDSTHCSPINLH